MNSVKEIFDNHHMSPSGIPEGLSACRLCPRECGADRLSGRRGFCGAAEMPRVARAAPHHWEEPCISGDRGSGTVFFSGCNLGCIFCQNREISTGRAGKEVTIERLSDIFLELQDRGAHNINLVTPAHFLYQIREALMDSKRRGLSIPIVYNTGSYEKAEELRKLSGLVDIYLPDMKFHDSELSFKLAGVKDYFVTALGAIDEMFSQVGKPVMDSGTGLMKKGVIVRHLVLPGHKRDSLEIIRRLYQRYGDDIYISIMNQYTPMLKDKGDIAEFPELGRRVTKREYACVVDYAIDLGVTNAFIQQGDTAQESFIPAFDLEGV